MKSWRRATSFGSNILKRSITTQPVLPLEIFQKLPKTELHLHLDGSGRPSTMLELIKKHNIDVPGYDQPPPLDVFKNLVVPGPQTKSLKQFLESYRYCLLAFQTPDALERITWEVARDCGSENVRYLEIRFCPELHTERGMTSEEALDVVTKATKEISKQALTDRSLPITRVIVCSLRHLGHEHSLKMAHLTADYFSKEDRQVVAFDIAGPEAEFPVTLFREACDIVQESGVGITIHAGEAAGWESVYGAVQYGATRIGHGVALQNNPTLMNDIIEEKVGLELCMTSNKITKACPSVEDHPVDKFLNNGILCTLCTDGITVIPTTISEEYFLGQNAKNLSPLQLINLARNGFEMAFLEDKAKEHMIKSVEQEIINLVDEYPEIQQSLENERRRYM